MTSEATSTFDGRALSARVQSFVRYLEQGADEPALPSAPPLPSEAAVWGEALAAEELRLQVESIREAERQIELDRDQDRELFNLAPDALVVTDLGGVARAVNAAAARMLDEGGLRLLGRGLVERVEADDRPRFWETVKRAAGGVAEAHLWLHDRQQGRTLVRLRGAIMKDGRRILWSARPTAAPTSEDDRVEELTETLRERSDQLAHALARCEGLEAQARSREASLALLAHELRAPTDVIIGWSRLLRGGGSDEHERARAMATIERNAVAQSVLVDDLVEAWHLAARKLTIRREPTDVGEIARAAVEAMRPAAEARALTISCDAPTGLMVDGDRARLAQVMSNLLTNAVKFTSGGGSITVRCALHSPQGARRPTVVVEVTDTGTGIQPNDLGHLFAYRRHCHAANRRSSGLGLGLFLVRELVELHGGSATVRSAGKGKGATFVVSLPAQAG